MAKRPWFKLWTAEWLIDTSVMTLEEQGAYMRLLCLQWRDGFIPIDERRLSLALGVSVDRYTQELRGMVEAHFPNGQNPRLERERKDADDVSEQSASNGRKGGNKRASARLDLVQALLKQTPSGIVASQKKEERRKKERERTTAPSAPREPTPVFQVVEAWKTGWAERFKPADGRAPEPNDVDWKQAKNLLGAHGLDASLALVTRFLDDTDKFVAERGHMLRDLPSRLARYAKGDGPLFRTNAPLPPCTAELEHKTETLP